MNDNRPEFLQPEYKFYVSEKDSNRVESLLIMSEQDEDENTRLKSGLNLHYVGSVRAIDRDSHSDLVYYIVDASNENYKAYFEINTATDRIDDDRHDSPLSSKVEPVYDLEDFEFSESSIYEVTAIKHLPSLQQSSSQVFNEDEEPGENNVEYVFNYTDFKQSGESKLFSKTAKKKVSSFCYIHIFI